MGQVQVSTGVIGEDWLMPGICGVLVNEFSGRAFLQSIAAFDLYTGDGHFHAAAVHDACDAGGKRHAPGHVLRLDLLSQAMRHLDRWDAFTRSVENEIGLLKRQAM